MNIPLLKVNFQYYRGHFFEIANTPLRETIFPNYRDSFLSFFVENLSLSIYLIKLEEFIEIDATKTFPPRLSIDARRAIFPLSSLALHPLRPALVRPIATEVA